MNIPEILNQIRSKRRRLNYSQEYLATKLAISQKTYSKIETNVIELTIGRLILICDILDIDVCSLLNMAQRESYPASCVN